tara:strand:- start:37 stop:726 length:690 start_codon:yes stop_codon:yes gene_type:complete
MNLKISGLDDYLFHSEGLIDFVVIETELQQLNDYAVLVTESVHKQLNDKKKLLKEYKAGEKKAIVSENDNLETEDRWMVGQDFTDDHKTILDEEILDWKTNVGFITPSMILVLLYFLTEKSLKNLCYSFSEGEGEYVVPAGKRFKIKNNKNESLIEANIRYLKEKCNFNFQIDEKIISLLYQCNKIRNNFAHGDWINVEEDIVKIDLASAFKAISSLFRSIEQGAPSKN